MKINEKNLCTFATQPPVDLEGWLNKRGEVNRSWQRRWFVLKGNLLFYFEKKGDKEPLGVIILEGCTIELAEEGEQYCFKIIFHGQNDRSYILSAENQEMMEKWMKALTCAGYEYMKLMVAELQRQLDELEESNKLENGNSSRRSENGVELRPKPPPRRQNPFNKPAPDSSSPAHLRPAPMVPHRSPRQGARGAQVQAETAEPERRADEEVLEPQPRRESDEISFQLVHEALGKPFVEEMNRRKAAQTKAMNNERDDKGSKEEVDISAEKSSPKEAKKDKDRTESPLLIDLL